MRLKIYYFRIENFSENNIINYITKKWHCVEFTIYRVKIVPVLKTSSKAKSLMQQDIMPGTTLQIRYRRIYVERKYYCLLHQTALKLRFEEHKIGICSQSLIVIIFVCRAKFSHKHLYPIWFSRVAAAIFDTTALSTRPIERQHLFCTASKHYYSTKAYEINCKVYIFVCFSYIYCYYTYIGNGVLFV